MAYKIHYTVVTFNRPELPLHKSAYDNLKKMGATDFKEYLDAVGSGVWQKFRTDQKDKINIAIWGCLGGAAVGFIFQKIEFVAFIGILAIMFGVVSIFCILYHVSNYTEAVFDLKKFYGKRRELIVVANSYEEYVISESKLKK